MGVVVGKHSPWPATHLPPCTSPQETSVLSMFQMCLPFAQFCTNRRAGYVSRGRSAAKTRQSSRRALASRASDSGYLTCVVKASSNDSMSPMHR